MNFARIDSDYIAWPCFHRSAAARGTLSAADYETDPELIMAVASKAPAGLRLDHLNTRQGRTKKADAVGLRHEMFLGR
jgi:hypothetical protein